MNQPRPTVEEFLGTPYSPEEDDDSGLEQAVEQWKADPGVLWQLPESPLESIAHDVRAILNHLSDGPDRTGAAVGKALNGAARANRRGYVPVTEPVEAPHTWARKSAETGEELRLIYEKLADAEAQLETVTQVVVAVEEALGKSKAAPALAAKAVIEAWRNPQVPQTEGEGQVPETPAEHLPGHTRTEAEAGEPFCQECSYAAQDDVLWPCPEVKQAFEPLAEVAQPSTSGAVVPVQPEQGAPVEEWRAYARALGYAGPEIDNANRSQIRTALGISQTAPEA